MFPSRWKLRLRFLTDADIAGTERLAVSEIKKDYATQHISLDTAEISDSAKGLLGPMTVFLVKGWSRCLCAVVCLLHAYEDPDTVLKAG